MSDNCNKSAVRADTGELVTSNTSDNWNFGSGDILVTDVGKLLVVFVEDFVIENVWAYASGDIVRDRVEVMLVDMDRGGIEACIRIDDLEDLWRHYSIYEVIRG